MAESGRDRLIAELDGLIDSYPAPREAYPAVRLWLFRFADDELRDVLTVHAAERLDLGREVDGG